MHSLIDDQHQLAAIGDWCIRGRVESAFLSGLDASQRIRKLIQVSSSDALVMDNFRYTALDLNAIFAHRQDAKQLWPVLLFNS